MNICFIKNNTERGLKCKYPFQVFTCAFAGPIGEDVQLGAKGSTCFGKVQDAPERKNGHLPHTTGFYLEQ